MAEIPVVIMRALFSLPCPVPVVPGTPEVLGADGWPLPLEQRTEKCCVDAWWMIGNQVTCDIHLRVACGHLKIDFDEVIEESGGLNHQEKLPWAERHRYSQDDPAIRDEA